MQDTIEANELDDPFSEEELKQLQGLVYRRGHVDELLAMGVDLEDGFHRHLLRTVADDAIAYNSIMVKFEGDPSGVEFRSSTRESWAFVLPDASDPGKQRVQYFDRDGFVRHAPYKTVADCVDAMVGEGFTVEDAGALDRESMTARWSKGVEVARLMQLLNTGQISFTEFCERRARL